MGQIFSSNSKCSFNIGCGIDSVNSVDKTINSVLFRPPNTNLSYIKGLHNGQNIHLINLKGKNDMTISAIKLDPENSPRKYVIFSHGNGSDIYTMSRYLKYLCKVYNICVICYDYNGYGLSEGSPSEENCYHCLETVVKYVLDIMEIPEDKIILMGQSLGTGITVDYAWKYNWNSAIVLISPYKSIPRVMYDSSLADICVNNYKFKSISKIKNLTCPVKIFHGEQDQIIDVSHGKDLYKKVKNKKFSPVWIKNADHNDIISLIEYKDLDEVFSC